MSWHDHVRCHALSDVDYKPQMLGTTTSPVTPVSVTIASHGVFTYAIYNSWKASPSHYGRVNFRFCTKWFKHIMWFPFMWTECNKYFFILLCFLSFVQIPIIELSLIHMRITNIVHVSRSFPIYVRISPFFPLQGNYFHFDFSVLAFRVLWDFTCPQQLNVHVALVTLTRPSKGQKRQATWTWKLAIWDFLNSDKWLEWATKILKATP